MPFPVATSVRPSRLKSAVSTPYGWAAPTASGDPSWTNDACAGAVMNAAPSATIPGRSLLISPSSPPGRHSAIDNTYSPVEDRRIGSRSATLDSSGEKVADPSHFCRVLQAFR